MPIIDHNDVPEVPWRPGYRKWDVTLQEHGVSTSLSLNTAEPGTGAPLHTHAIDELIKIMEGTLEVRIDGETITVEKDHTVVIPPGAEHGFAFPRREGSYHKPSAERHWERLFALFERTLK